MRKRKRVKREEEKKRRKEEEEEGANPQVGRAGAPAVASASGSHREPVPRPWDLVGGRRGMGESGGIW